MLCSPFKVTADEVRDHYDELDEFYRSIWGRNLHHGLWSPGDSSSVEAATTRLLNLLLPALSLKPGIRLVDIGCGYGADAHRIAEQTGAWVSGITLSHAQEKNAREIIPPSRGAASIEQGDWLQNTYPAQSFDSALAIESLSHMQDKKRFFFELHRVLVPGGRAAIACWTIDPAPSAAEKLLLRILCLSGALPSFGSICEYRKLAYRVGLSPLESRDLTTFVEPTWALIARKAIQSLTHPRFLAATLKLALRRPLLSFAIPVMILAFRTGALRYSAFWMERKI